MANSEEYIEYVLLRLESFGFIQYKKMFGEGMVYIDGKPILLVVGNSCYLKKWPELADLMGKCQIAVPYEGSTEKYIVDLEDEDLFKWLKIAWTRQPFPKKKSKKSSD